MQQLAFVPPPASPIRQQYLALKHQHPDAILFFQLGDFFETFEDDARLVASVCDVVLTSREMGRGERVAMAGMPIHAAESYVARLVERGHHIAICEQVGDPSAERGSSLVRREVTRVITPGTLVDLPLLTRERSNYLVALVTERRRTGIAYAEISTGEFACAEIDGLDHAALARAEMWRLQPAECLLEDDAVGAAVLPVGAPTTVDASLFNMYDASSILSSHFGVASPAALGLSERPLATRAAAAILRYVGRTQPRAAGGLGRLHIYDAQGFMILDPATRDHLELVRGAGQRREGSLLRAIDRTRTPMGARLLTAWLGHPLLDRNTIEERHDRVAALLADVQMRLELQHILGRLPDLERLSGRATQRLLTPREANAIADAIEIAAEARAALQRAHVGPLAALVSRIDPPPDLVDRIRTMLPPDPPPTFGEGVIRTGVNAELDELRVHSTDGRRWLLELERRERERTGVKNLKVGYNRVFGYFLEVTTAAVSQPLDLYRQQETGAKTIAELLERLGYQRRQTLTSAERFVTGELREHEAQQARAATRMGELERQVFADLGGEIAACALRLLDAAQALAEADTLASLAQLAEEQRYVRPEMVDEPISEIVGGRHPVVEQVIGWNTYIPGYVRLAAGTDSASNQPGPSGGARTTPLPSPASQGGRGLADLSDGLPQARRTPSDPQVMVLTGPNMAGKTTYGRMALLVTLLGQCGSFVPAERARLGLVDRVFLRSGAGDDIAGGQSTFMVEMTETAAILRSATRRSLAFFDEVGRGTSTYDGMALARAIVEYLARPGLGCRTIFSTHYHELAAIEEEQPTVRNFQMDVQETTNQVAFTYRVVPGAADRSYGVHVAKLAGLPSSVVDRANQVLEELEAGRGPGSPAPYGMPGRPVPQRPRLPDLIYQLADLDANHLTPIEALAELDRLRSSAAKLISGGPGPTADGTEGDGAE